MLLENYAGDRLSYPIAPFALFFKGEHFKDFMVEPTHMRAEGQMCYRFVMMGFVILIIVSNQNPPKLYEKLIIDPAHPIRTYDSELTDFKFLKAVWDKVGETTKDVEI